MDEEPLKEPRCRRDFGRNRNAATAYETEAWRGIYVWEEASTHTHPCNLQNTLTVGKPYEQNCIPALTRPLFGLPHTQ
jgi:hypothetical protein